MGLECKYTLQTSLFFVNYYIMMRCVGIAGRCILQCYHRMKGNYFLECTFTELEIWCGGNLSRCVGTHTQEYFYSNYYVRILSLLHTRKITKLVTLNSSYTNSKKMYYSGFSALLQNQWIELFSHAITWILYLYMCVCVCTTHIHYYDNVIHNARISFKYI